MVMLPQLSQAGASDWKSANCSLRAVLGPASLGMMPARARSAAVISGPEPLAISLAWPFPFVCPFVPRGARCRVSGVGGERVAVGPESLRLPLAAFGLFSATGGFPATGGRGFIGAAVVTERFEPPAEPGTNGSSLGSAL